MNTGGINKPQTGRAYHNRFFHRISGSACNFRYNDSLIAGQGIQQAGFSHIGLAHNGGSNTLTENATLTVGLQQSIESLGILPQSAGVVFQTEIVNILIGVIQHSVEMTAKIRKVIVNRAQFFLQNAAHLAGSIGGRISGICLNKINNCLCLGQIQLPIQKGTLGKFSSLSGKRAFAVKGIQSGSQHSRGAVAVEFYRIFTCIGVGCPGVNCHTTVNGSALLVRQCAKDQLAVGGFP